MLMVFILIIVMIVIVLMSVASSHEILAGGLLLTAIIDFIAIFSLLLHYNMLHDKLYYYGIIKP